MKASELRGMSDADLKEQIQDELKALNDLVFKHSVTGQLEKPHLISQYRRNIARIKTILHERELTSDNA